MPNMYTARHFESFARLVGYAKGTARECSLPDMRRVMVDECERFERLISGEFARNSARFNAERFAAAVEQHAQHEQASIREWDARRARAALGTVDDGTSDGRTSDGGNL